MEKEFKSKLDPSCVVNTLFFAALFVVYFLFASRINLWIYIVGCSILGLIVLISLPIIFFTRYKFKENYLLIRYGIFTQRIYYKDITSVKDVKNLYPSFCSLSIDRVEIKYEKYFLPTYLSPKNKAEFISELNGRIAKVDRSLYE